MVTCLELGADLHMVQLMPLPLAVSCFIKIQIGFAFWYWLTRVVQDKGPLNGCVCVCVQRAGVRTRACVRVCIYRLTCISRHLQLRTGGFFGAKFYCPHALVDDNWRIWIRVKMLLFSSAVLSTLSP